MADRIEKIERKRKYCPESPIDLRFSAGSESLPVLGTKKQITKIVEQMDFTGYGCLYRIYNIKLTIPRNIALKIPVKHTILSVHFTLPQLSS